MIVNFSDEKKTQLLTTPKVIIELPNIFHVYFRFSTEIPWYLGKGSTWFVIKGEFSIEITTYIWWKKEKFRY